MAGRRTEVLDESALRHYLVQHGGYRSVQLNGISIARLLKLYDEVAEVTDATPPDLTGVAREANGFDGRLPARRNAPRRSF